MQPVPSRFLIRLARRCQYRKNMPLEKSGLLLDLPESFIIPSLSEMDHQPTFAQVRMAWNESGLGLQVHVEGKKEPLQGDLSRPRTSDGVTFWLDTRDSRSSHRGTRYCHMFHFLPTGGGPDKESPAFAQSKIHRALQDAPEANPGEIAYRFLVEPTGYNLEAYLPATALTGYDPEECPTLGMCLQIHDRELGNQIMDSATEFPFAEDPSLWSQLLLVREQAKKKGPETRAKTLKKKKQSGE